MFDLQSERIQAHRRVQTAAKPDVLVGETPGFGQTQPPAQLGVVAEFGMDVQRQVIGEQVEFVRDEQRDARAAGAGEAGILALPEIAVVHQDGIRVVCERALNQFEACGHAAYDAADFTTPFHLQPIWAIIPKSGDLQQAVQVTV